MAAAISIACGGFALVRTGGITGDGLSDLHWRWNRTPEERLRLAVAYGSAAASLPGTTIPAPGQTHPEQALVKALTSVAP